MAGKNLFNKVWDEHSVRELPNGQTQLFIGLHLIHEVTSPQAFEMLREMGLSVRFPSRTFATVDHIIPTDDQKRPFADPIAEEMMIHLENNCREAGIALFDTSSGRQGIVHVIGPELGLTQPGMTLACGDSHTSSHGAYGSIAFGIGTSQVRDVLATQTLAMGRLKVRKVDVAGKLGRGVYAKDVTLDIIRRTGAKGGVGFAYEYAGSVVESFSMEERLTLCNMSIEGGARVGYVNPDEITYNDLKGKAYAPSGAAFGRALSWWNNVKSDSDAEYDDIVEIQGSEIEPTVTWGINPGQAVGINQPIPRTSDLPDAERAGHQEAVAFMDVRTGEPIAGTKIDVAFIGSCTNSRISDLREAARIAQTGHVASHVRALVVPGSQAVQKQAELEGLPEIFQSAGFEWREPGCSMCLAMNTDRLKGREICASSSNRNFKGRQGSPTGRTLLMSPAMVAAAAIRGNVVDVREVI